MKKIIFILLCFCFISLTSPLSCLAQDANYVKVIYSLANVYADADINVDYNDDEISDVIYQAAYGEELKLQSLDAITGDDGLKYYSVELTDGVGYVLCSNVLNVKFSSPQKDLDANARLAKDAELYLLENAEYRQTGKLLSANEQIKLLEQGPNFTKIQYKDADGSILTVYVKTENIKQEGISRGTIGAIIIVVTTISIVLVVFGIKGKNKKKYKKIQNKK